MNRNVLILIFNLITSCLFAQDIVYTIHSEFNQTPVPLDSIVIVNITNGSRIGTDPLPVQDYYVINLSEVATGINPLPVPAGFAVARNLPGEITIINTSDNHQNGVLSILDPGGRILYQQFINHLLPGASVEVSLGHEGLFFIQMATKNSSKIFKAIGTPLMSQGIKVSVGDNFILKKASSKKESEFVYSLGDSIQISVFRESYHAKPLVMEIVKSDSLDFQLYKSFTDSRDNREYYYIRIGDKNWMANDLSYLPVVNPASAESNTDSMYYVYGYGGTDVIEAKVQDSYKTYGVLYNWVAALTACPRDWHLPSVEEWDQLAQFISDQKGPYEKVEGNWNEVGGHLKATSGWRNEGNGTDDFGFTGLPGGYRNFDESFYYLGGGGYWWSSTEYDQNIAWFLGLDYGKSTFFKNNDYKENGFNVRCVKD